MSTMPKIVFSTVPDGMSTMTSRSDAADVRPVAVHGNDARVAAERRRRQLMNHPRGRRIGNVDDRQAGEAVGHRNERALERHRLRVAGRVDLGDRDRCRTGSDVEHRDAVEAVGDDRQVVSDRDVDGEPWRVGGRDDAGPRRQAVQRVRALLHFGPVVHAVAVAVDLPAGSCRAPPRRRPSGHRRRRPVTRSSNSIAGCRAERAAGVAGDDRCRRRSAGSPG